MKWLQISMAVVSMAAAQVGAADERPADKKDEGSSDEKKCVRIKTDDPSVKRDESTDRRAPCFMRCAEEVIIHTEGQSESAETTEMDDVE